MASHCHRHCSLVRLHLETNRLRTRALERESPEKESLETSQQVTKHLGNGQLSGVFPEYAQPKFRGLIAG